MKRSLLAILGVWFSMPLLVTAQSAGYLGNASCAASTCHGGVVGQGPSWNHSLSMWIAHDPHAGAGLLLRDPDSREIVQRLNPKAADSAEIYDTVLRRRCISCHATPTLEQCQTTGPLDDDLLAEGVSCEACHGAADQWLEAHVRSEFSGPHRFETGTGMNDTESILGRAEICVRCHVGSRIDDGLVRDMNHDLIAAGHPALRFDLLLYSDNLPKHWSTESPVEERFSESAMRVHGVGRAVNLAAATSLSARRASDHLNDPAVPWPELSDYDCFACHQALSVDEYQLPPAAKNQSSLRVSDGLPIWNAWHTIRQYEMHDKKDLLQKLSPHQSDPNRISAGAGKLAAEFRKIALRKATENLDPQAMLKDRLRELQSKTPIDWHHAAFVYLEIEAALRDLQQNQDNSIASKAKQYLDGVRKAERYLRFDPERFSERKARYHSPKAFDADRFRTAILNAFRSPSSAGETLRGQTINTNSTTNKQ